MCSAAVNIQLHALHHTGQPAGIQGPSKATFMQHQHHLCNFSCMDENHLHCHQRHQHGLTSIPFPRAPRRDHDLDQIQQALNEGTISIYLQDSTVKMRLSLQCQLCPFTTTRLSGLFKHLQCAHGHLWLISSDLATMLQHCWQGTCICNPAPVARRGHSCVGWNTWP